MKTLCFGSLNIDYVYRVPHFVQKGETLAANSLIANSGGKGLNQSIALSKAGLNVYHAGAVGTDGEFLLDQLKSENVNIDYVARLDDVRTGHAIIQNDAEGDNCILLFGGANRKISREHIDATLKNFSKGDALVLQNEINDLLYIAQQAKKIGMIIALNPSPMEKNLLDVIPYADYLLLNEIEAAQLLGIDGKNEDFETTAKNLHQKYPNASILMTLGSKGSIFVNSDNFVRQDIIKVKPVDTTAAGDTYTGFFLENMFNGNDIQTSMKYASIASSIAITRPGAAQSIPTKKEVLSWQGTF